MRPKQISLKFKTFHAKIGRIAKFTKGHISTTLVTTYFYTKPYRIIFLNYFFINI